MTDSPIQGSLFAVDFLQDTIRDLPEWSDFDDARLDALLFDLKGIFKPFPVLKSPNESQTEDDLIWPILVRLGWTQSLRQQNLAAHGRDDVPDGLLFADETAKAQANGFREQWRHYEFGRAIVESKRWARPLDRQSGSRGEETAPSTQMLRYLRRVDDLTRGALRWGILTNGARWRLYYQGARSVSENFFEIDLALLLAIPDHDGGLFAPSDDQCRHWLKVFALIFQRDAFVPVTADARTFHQRAIEQGRFYEERVAASLSNLVFGHIFPTLAQAIAAAAPEAPLTEVRDAALVLLYRLLFILYAEDRNLLPVNDVRYEEYGLRNRVRLDVGKKLDRNDPLSETAARYWSVLDDLCRAIDKGDRSIGLPPYNGGLFDPAKTPLLTQVRLGDSVMASVIDALSFEKTTENRKYINYRDLSVQQLGSIYERLLEHQVTRVDGAIRVQPNVFARKGSGSYYTPDDLVNLIIKETIDPLVSARMEAFADKVKEMESDKRPLDRRLGMLMGVDPAEKLLEVKICDPAMGSGHFLVSLVDYLADRVITAMADAQAEVAFGDYISPLIARVAAIRTTILRNADERGWTIDLEQLDDRHIIRRMVLKRCIYGVDKNPMAVELAKVALWLHTFTVGAPLSFLDHHLRNGDSLFGSWVRQGVDRATALGAPLFLHESLTKALRAAAKMQIIEGLTDAEIAEAHRSKDVFDEVQDMTAPLNAILSLIHALGWQNLRANEDKAALQAFLTGQFGDPVLLALGKIEPDNKREKTTKPTKDGLKRHKPAEEVFERFAKIFSQARELIAEEDFLNWQVAFPGVWSNWEGDKLTGGFDAVIGNPPWDRMKLQQVEWFAARKPEIALAQRASDRARMIRDLERAEDPLAQDYAKASERAETALRVARRCGDYPLLSGGDVNLYSLFVERSFDLVKPQGMVGLLVPIGIGADKTSADYISSVTRKQQLKAFISFENKRRWLFKDVHAEDQPTILITANAERQYPKFRYAVKLHSIPHDQDNLTVMMDAAALAAVNPNTGTMPIFRSAEDAKIVAGVYSRAPVFVRKSEQGETSDWNARYLTMFHMTNESWLFRNKHELGEQEGAWPVGQQRYESEAGPWLPLYEGKSIQIYNHRYASIITPAGSVSGQGQSIHATMEELSSPDFVPTPRYWVNSNEVESIKRGYAIGFNDVCNTNNERSLISAIVPKVGAGNTLPLLDELDAPDCALLIGNLNTIPCDYVARNKIQSRHLNKYILEQLPIIPPTAYARPFGLKSAAQIVRAAVLELTYTAHDMAPFARDMGHTDKAGNVLPPFAWDEDRRLKLRAKLDAIYFHLYGVTDRDDVRYIYSTFPITEREEMAAFNRYRSRDLCLAYMNALAAGDPDADIDL